MEEHLQRARAQLTRATGGARSASLSAWRRWIMDGFTAGARNAHLFSRLPAEWKPTEVQTQEGAKASDPKAILDHQRTRYKLLWRAEEQPGGYTWTERDALVRLTADELREASRSFKRRTASTFDGFHCRHYALMGNGALDTLAAILETCERIGRMPTRLGLVTTPLLEKPKGGYRPSRSTLRCIAYGRRPGRASRRSGNGTTSELTFLRQRATAPPTPPGGRR